MDADEPIMEDKNNCVWLTLSCISSGSVTCIGGWKTVDLPYGQSVGDRFNTLYISEISIYIILGSLLLYIHKDRLWGQLTL
jgi:hypothetical protein